MQLEGKQPRIGTIRISEDERSSGKISANNLQECLREFHKNGVVILQDVVGISALDHVKEKMLQDIPKNLSSPNIHYNFGRNTLNVSQTLPLSPAYLHEEIWANRLAVTVLEHIIGPRPQLSHASSNVALPGGQGRQAVHSDYYCSHLDFPVFLQASIFLDDVFPENGSTEFWLGTHHGYNKKDHISPNAGWIKREVFTERARVSPPFQPVISKGSICIRDLRLWHAGMPNVTGAPRIMLAFTYSPRWFDSHMRIRFPAESKQRIESWDHIDCLSVAEFMEGDLDYLESRQVFHLEQEKPDPNVPYIPRHGTTVIGPEHYWTPDNEE